MGEEALRDAVEHSGYPLQTVIAGFLADRGYRIDEEWGWLDQDRDVERTLDVLAERRSDDWQDSDRGQVLPVRSLLIECKQSRNPYLGFAAVSPPALRDHPRVIGLNYTMLRIHSDQDQSFARFPIVQSLGLTSHPYLSEPLIISSLSRAHPNGKRVEISGEETFNSLVRPLTKAARRYVEHWRTTPARNRTEFVARLIFPVAVVDAPLLAVRGRRGNSDIEPTQWLRVISRHAADGNQQLRKKLGFDVVDVVHADFIETYLDHYLDPFFEAFISSLAQIQDLVLDGKAVLPGYDAAGPLPYNALEKLRPYGT